MFEFPGTKKGAHSAPLLVSISLATDLNFFDLFEFSSQSEVVETTFITPGVATCVGIT